MATSAMSIAQTQFKTRSLDEDGVSEEFFSLLWTKDELNFAPSVNIPDTIFFKFGQPIVWYFTSIEGRIKRKNRQNLANIQIEEAFTKHNLGYDVIGTFISIPIERDGVTGVLPPSTIQYLDLDGLKNLLNNRSKDLHGVLQRFIEPKTTKNEIIRAVWSPKVCLLERSENIHELHDRRYGLYERCVTFEGPQYFFKSSPLRGPVLAGHVQKICDSIVTHVSEVTFNRLQIARVVINFKLDSRDKIWLLYTTSLRYHSTTDVNLSINPTSGIQSLSPIIPRTGKKLINMDSVLTLPSSVLLHHGKISTEMNPSIIEKKKLKTCLSCGNHLFDDHRYPVTFKTIMKHYDHYLIIAHQYQLLNQLEDLPYPPNEKILEAVGGVGFGCLSLIKHDRAADAHAKSSSTTNAPITHDPEISPILFYLHRHLDRKAYEGCYQDPIFLNKTIDVVNHVVWFILNLR